MTRTIHSVLFDTPADESKPKSWFGHRTRMAATNAALAGGAMCGGQAIAQEATPAADYKFFAHIGLANVSLADEGEFRANGAPIPGAGIATPDKTAPSIEIGYKFSPNFAVAGSLQGTYKTNNIATGSLAGTGNLVTDTFGFATLAGQWRYANESRFEPYLGVGVAYYFLTDIEDGATQNVDITDEFGPMLQAGIDVELTERFGAYVDIKQMYHTATATGSLGPASIVADAILDPVVISAGVSVKF